MDCFDTLPSPEQKALHPVLDEAANQGAQVPIHSLGWFRASGSR